MTTEVVTLTSVCAGGQHLYFSLTGAKVMSVPVTLEILTEPISDEDAIVFCRIIAKMARAGRSLNQARSLLEAGVTITV